MALTLALSWHPKLPRAVRVRASWVLIWAWGGVLPSRVGVLRELRYKGLWMALAGNKYRLENSIRDIHGRNQWRHAPPLSVYCLSGCTRTARVSKTRKLLFSAPADLEPAVKCTRWLVRGAAPLNSELSHVHLARVLPMGSAILAVRKHVFRINECQKIKIETNGL